MSLSLVVLSVFYVLLDSEQTIQDDVMQLRPDGSLNVVCYACTSGSLIVGEERVHRELKMWDHLYFQAARLWYQHALSDSDDVAKLLVVELEEVRRTITAVTPLLSL